MPENKAITTEQRREKIILHLSGHTRGGVTELSHLLGVTEVTVRKDLAVLETQGLLTRVHGGALISGRGRVERQFAAREQENLDEKQRIAQAAAALIQSGQRIFLDASTTALQIARVIHDREDLVVVTNGLYTALELSFCAGITTFVIGGMVRPRSNSLVGSLTEEWTQRLRIDMGFFGARGVTPPDGLMESDLDEAQLKQRMVKISSTVVGIIDASKFGAKFFSVFALPKEINRIITGLRVPAATVSELQASQIQVTLV
jgi:DeoR/GlpR family transcriptional regulator of sugar metabolism